jgi:hypothetical protein
MKPTKDTSKATFDRAPDPTGRDGAIDFTAKAEGRNPSEVDLSDQTGRFAQVMGTAIIDLWSELPQDIQEKLFERAVVLGHHGERDEMLREQLAKFLHDHHQRTAR